MHAIQQRPAQPRRGDPTPPGLRRQAGQAALDQRRRIGHHMRTLVTGGHHRAQAPRLDMRAGHRDGGNREINLPAYRIRRCRAAAFIRDMHHLDRCLTLHQHHCEMPQAAAAHRAKRQRRRFGLGRAQHIGKILEGFGRVGGQHHGCGADNHDIAQIFLRVIRQIRNQRWIHRMRIKHNQKSITVGRGFRSQRRADGT